MAIPYDIFQGEVLELYCTVLYCTVSDIWSWFALINQIVPFIASASIMESIHNFYNQQKPMAKIFGTASYLKSFSKKQRY